MKSRSVFVCQECGYRSLKWLGKCPSCGAWGSLVEELVEVERSSARGNASSPVLLGETPTLPAQRIRSGIDEFDRVMGGGIVPGSVTVIGGDPGVGKSTLMLTLCAALADHKPLYVTGEESLEQLRYRAERLHLTRQEVAVLSEQCLEDILATLESYTPGLVVVDSIQTLYTRQMESLPGSIGQVRTCAGQLVQWAKRTGRPVFLVGHVTKEGVLAGPKVLEHMVDVTIQFEGEGNYAYRILRATKNRYGSTNEIGVFEMRNEGLVAVPNPSAVFLTHRLHSEPGTAVSAILEGTRSLLVEIQALVVPSGYGIAQRIATGFDTKRLQMLLAVLESRLGMEFSHTDVFLNIAGGLAVRDPGVDLAVCAAVISSLRNSPLAEKAVAIGEVGLTGELRQVAGMDMRLKEAEKLGFTFAVVPLSAQAIPSSSIRIEVAQHLGTAVEKLLL